MTTTDNQYEQTAKTRRGQASTMKRHQKHKAKKAQHAATRQHGWRCEYNSTRCDDDDEKTAPQMVRGAGHTFLFAFWLSTHFAGVCRSFPELPYHRHHPTATGIAVAANDAPLTKQLAKRRIKNLAKPQRKADWNPNWANARVTSRNHDKIGGNKIGRRFA